MLLIDSEATIDRDLQTNKPISAWKRLKNRDNWDCPDGATDDHLHLMVQCMESWLVADREQFIAYYSTGNRRCNPHEIPERADIEPLSKKDVFQWLEKTSKLSGKEQYSKGTRSFEILAIIRPEKVAAKSFHARRLFYHLGVTAQWLDRQEFE